jgi:hypothetical protein
MHPSRLVAPSTSLRKSHPGATERSTRNLSSEVVPVVRAVLINRRDQHRQTFKTSSLQMKTRLHRSQRVVDTNRGLCISTSPRRRCSGCYTPVAREEQPGYQHLCFCGLRGPALGQRHYGSLGVAHLTLSVWFPRLVEPVEKVAARPIGGSKSGAKCLEMALQATLNSQLGGREGHEGVFRQPRHF